LNNNTKEQELKVCTLCHEHYPISTEYFIIDRKGKYGLSSRCKSCLKKLRESKREEKRRYDQERLEKIGDKRRKQSKEWYWNNKEKKSEYDRKYRIENKEKRQEQKRRYYINNKEHCLKKSRENLERNKEHYLKYRMRYYQENKERIKQRAEVWRINNRDKFNINSQRRRARKKKTESRFIEKDWIKCKQAFNNKCAYCGKEDNSLTQEHFIPLSKGGEYTVNNIIPACKSCNSSKQDKDFEYWYQLMPFYSERRKNKIYKYLGYNQNTQQLALFK
jgi:hypothetical protein